MSMEKMTEALIGEMEEGLQQIAFKADNQLQLAERSFFFVETIIMRLKNYMATYNFKGKEEEILFFKTIKPQFQKELIYFKKLYYLEANKPLSTKTEQRKYYKQELKRLDRFFIQNRPFYVYYLLGEVRNDHEYYVREPEADLGNALLMATTDFDASFSTPYSYNLAKLQAYEAMKNYITGLLTGKQAVSTESNAEPVKRRKPRTWTGPKAAAEEVVIAISEMGWVSYGEGGIKALAADFELAFGIKLDNIYRAFAGMTIRKKGYTPYLDGMKIAVENKIKKKHE